MSTSTALVVYKKQMPSWVLWIAVVAIFIVSHFLVFKHFEAKAEKDAVEIALLKVDAIIAKNEKETLEKEINVLKVELTKALSYEPSISEIANKKVITPVTNSAKKAYDYVTGSVSSTVDSMKGWYASN